MWTVGEIGVQGLGGAPCFLDEERAGELWLPKLMETYWYLLFITSFSFLLWNMTFFFEKQF